MVLNGVMARYTNMKVILSHAGGFLPYAAERLAVTTSVVSNGKRSKDDTITDLKRFYFDTALSGSPESLSCLLKFAAPGHILYGSDWPYLPSDHASFFNDSEVGFNAHKRTYREILAL
jgi:predicted TIM-barrel fold metal-dependent hydrolase